MQEEKEEKRIIPTSDREIAILFSGFEEGDIVKLLKAYGSEQAKRGDIIFKEGEEGSKLYFLVSGRVKIGKSLGDEEEVLAILEPGSCFGEMALIDQSPRSATVTAETDCLLFSIDDGFLRETDLELQLKLYKNFARLLSERLRRTNGRVVELAEELSEARRAISRR